MYTHAKQHTYNYKHYISNNKHAHIYTPVHIQYITYLVYDTNTRYRSELSPISSLAQPVEVLPEEGVDCSPCTYMVYYNI